MAKKPNDGKARRLAEALKANLKRRKEQARLRGKDGEPPAPATVELNRRKPSA